MVQAEIASVPATGCREGRSQLCSLLYRRPRVLPPSYGVLTRYDGVFSSQAAVSQLMTCRFERIDAMVGA